jgi:hypothetical protein
MRTSAACLLAVAAALAAAPAALGAPVPTPLAPVGGASVAATPPPGFANADVPLQWSITYDCPGPASIHSSYPQARVAGQGGFLATQRGGPFLGDGTFTTPLNVFPGARPVTWEWQVFWACGATDGFAGAQGTSQAVTFTLLPAGAAAPGTDACAGLAGRARATCRAKATRTRQLERCAERQGAARRGCEARARAAYRRALALFACGALSGERRAACQARARAAYRRAVALHACSRLAGEARSACVARANAAFRRAVA